MSAHKIEIVLFINAFYNILRIPLNVTAKSSCEMMCGPARTHCLVIPSGSRKKCGNYDCYSDGFADVIATVSITINNNNFSCI